MVSTVPPRASGEIRAHHGRQSALAPSRPLQVPERAEVHRGGAGRNPVAATGVRQRQGGVPIDWRRGRPQKRRPGGLRAPPPQRSPGARGSPPDRDGRVRPRGLEVPVARAPLARRRRGGGNRGGRVCVTRGARERNAQT